MNNAIKGIFEALLKVSSWAGSRGLAAEKPRSLSAETIQNPKQKILVVHAFLYLGRQKVDSLRVVRVFLLPEREYRSLSSISGIRKFRASGFFNFS